MTGFVLAQGTHQTGCTIAEFPGHSGKPIHLEFMSAPLAAGNVAVEEEREREFNLSIQPALAYEDTSMLESSANVRMAAKQ